MSNEPSDPRTSKLEKLGEFVRSAPKPGLWILLGGMALGGLLVFVGPLYVVIGAGALFFGYLLFFKIEIAVIIALLTQVQLGEFNYLGGGTAFHPAGIMGLSLIVGALYYFVFRVRRIDPSRFRPAAAFLAFFALCGLSLIRAGAFLTEGRNVTLRLATGLAVYMVLRYSLDSIKKVQWTAGAIIAAQIWPTISAFFGVAGSTGLEFSDETVRLGHSGMGVYLTIILTLCLVFFLGAEKTWARLLLGGLTGLFAVALFLSYGRAGWIGFVVALVVIGVMKHKTILLVLPVLLLAAVLLLPGVRQRFADISFDELGNRDSSTLANRVQYWRTALVITKSSPLFGVGYGTGRYRVGEYLTQYPWMIHNDYVSVLLETGLAGLLLFLVWHGQWLAALLRVFRTSAEDFDRTFALAVTAVFVASLVTRITDNLLLDSYKLYPICALVAAALALPRIRAQEQASAPGPGEKGPPVREDLRVES